MTITAGMPWLPNMDGKQLHLFAKGSWLCICRHSRHLYIADSGITRRGSSLPHADSSKTLLVTWEYWKLGSHRLYVSFRVSTFVLFNRTQSWGWPVYTSRDSDFSPIKFKIRLQLGCNVSAATSTALKLLLSFSSTPSLKPIRYLQMVYAPSTANTRDAHPPASLTCL